MNKKTALSPSLRENIEQIQQTFDNVNDLKVKEFEIGLEGQVGAVLFIEGMIDTNQLHLHVLKPLSERQAPKTFRRIQDLMLHFVGISQISVASDYETVYDKLLNGNGIVFLHGCKEALGIDARNIIGRSVGVPSIENVIYGPNESFVENLKINTILLRNRIKTTDLQIESLAIGKVTKSFVQMVYIKGLGNEQFIHAIRRRLHEIEVDAVYDVQNLIPMLVPDHKYSIMSTVHKTERPDTAASLLVEGRVIVMMDGTPIVLAAPALFLEFFQSSEDHYINYMIASIARGIRFIGFLLAMLSPGFFIALITFHQDMIPLTLLLSLTSQSQNVPFPTIFQLIIFELTFEVIREASTRLPRSIGSAVSLVGALIIGGTAVEAGLVMASVIIVVAITALCSFVFQTYAFSFSIRILRFAFIIIGYTFGLFGIIYGIVVLILYLSSIEVLGIPYLTGISPVKIKGLKDLFVQLPMKNFSKQLQVLSKILKKEG